MFFVTVLQHYVRWHYGIALVLYVRVYRNLAWFVTEFFSLSTLTLSLFAPFRRITETSTRRFDLGAWASALIINTLSRFLGASVRLLLLSFGLVVFFLLLVMSILGYAFWLVAPIISSTAIVGGGYLILISLL
jgi:hypothetical protein